MSHPSTSEDTRRYILRLLPRDLKPGQADAAVGFLEALGVDSHIPGLKSVSTELTRLLNAEIHLQPQISHIWRLLLSANQRIAEDPATLDWTHPKSLISSYPVLSCLLLAKSHDDTLSSALDSLKRLLLVGCILAQHGLIPSKIVHLAATEIRLSSDTFHERYRLALKLHFGDLNTNALISLYQQINQLLIKRDSSTVSLGFLRAIQHLVAGILQTYHSPLKSNSPHDARVENPASELGTIHVDTTESAEQDDDAIELLLEPDSEAGTELSNEGFRATAIQTAHLLSQSDAGLVWDRSRINPMEMIELCHLLSNLDQEVDRNRITYPVAVIAGLVAATALEPESILQMRIGDHAAISWDGKYRHTVNYPQSAFTISASHEAAYSDYFQGERVTEIDFELPPPLIDLLVTRRKTTLSDSTSVGDLLDIKFSTAKELSAKATELSTQIGKVLRETISPRLTYRHLRMVLRHTAYSHTRDYFLTYLISATPNIAPPVQMYYTSMTVEYVKQVHKEVMQKIFGNVRR